MNSKHIFLGGIAAFIAIFAFNSVFHGVVMHSMYEQTASLWRTEEEMRSYCKWMLLAQFIIGTTLSCLFSRNYERKGLGEGVRFGLYVGTLMGVLQFMAYAYMPIPFQLALAWLAGDIALGIWAGVVLAFTYGKLTEGKKKK